MNAPDHLSSRKLYVCPTPIGNLQDITLRALEVLGEVDLIACEDTRRTGKLLNHFDIDTPMISYHEHNAARRCQQILERMAEGEEVALVSDAGTPGISDPGSRLIEKSLEAGVEIVPLPGASALLPALVASGLPADRFVFEGFLPRSGQERHDRLAAIRREERTVVIYESPYRTLETLEELADLMPGRELTLVREISKLHEEKIYGTTTSLAGELEADDIKGEIVLVLAGSEEEKEQAGYEHLSVVEHVRVLMDNGYPKKEAIKMVAAERDLSRNEVYDEAIAIDARPRRD